MFDQQRWDYGAVRLSPLCNRFRPIVASRVGRRSKLLALAVIAYVLFYVAATVVFPSRLPQSRETVAQQSRGADGDERLAIMTYLSSTSDGNGDPKHDRYFQASRLLGWQLLHANETRIRKRKNIDFVVLVAENVSQSRRDILSEDGALVIPVEYLHVAGEEWLLDAELGLDMELHPEWSDLMTKFRAWQMTQYSRVLFVDADTILTNCCIEDIFDDPGSFPIARDDNGAQPDDEHPVPATYLLATVPEPRVRHSWPPTFRWAQHAGYPDIDYFCAGFFLFAPSQEMFQHYRSLIPLKDRFDGTLMEQSLLNYAHRRHGAGKMPWQNINFRWNVRFPKFSDIQGPDGAISVHEKWWYAHMDNAWENRLLGRPIQPLFESFKARMDEFYQARDESRANPVL